jgi:hypothetical protein
MNKFSSAAFIAAVLTLGLNAAPAQALNARSFISALGSDANACTRPLPCRTLQGAHDKTAAGGEINMLDPAGYGVVTINKSISIVNDGVGSAGILVTSGATGITINAGATDKINLRGLIIEGTGVGTYGITFNTGAALTVENCVVRNLTTHGINFKPTNTANITVANSSVLDNGGDGIYVVTSGSNNATGTISRTLVNNNNSGLVADDTSSFGSIHITIMDSIVAKNTTIGIMAMYETYLTVQNSAISNNGTGIEAFGSGSIIRLSQSTVTGNGSGWTAIAGDVFSYGNNSINDNAGFETAPPSVGLK